MPAAKKATAKKVTKKTVKKTAKKAVPKKTAKKQKSTKGSEKKNAKETVVLPTDAGPRLQSKVATINSLLTSLHRPMYRIAYVSAFSFMMVGLTAVTAELVEFPRLQVAQVCIPGTICDDPNEHSSSSADGTTSNDNSNSDDTNGSGGSNPTLPEPIFDLMGDIPFVLEEQAQIPFALLNTQAVFVELYNIETGDFHETEVEQLSANNYKLYLFRDQLTPGEYVIKIRTIALNQDIRIFNPGGFVVEEVEEIVDENSEDEIDESVDEEADDAADSDGVDETSNQTDNEVVDDEVDSSSGASATSTDTEVVIEDDGVEESEEQEDLDEQIEDEDEEDDVITTEENELDTEPDSLSLIVTNRQFIDRQVIKVLAPSTYENIELRARLKTATEALYIGSFTRGFDGWFYSFNTKNVPNGSYELFTTAELEDELVVSDSVIITVTNTSIVEDQPVVLPSDQPQPVGITDAVGNVDEPETIKEESPLNEILAVPEQVNGEVTDEPIEPEPRFIEINEALVIEEDEVVDELEEITREIFDNRREEIQEKFEIYSTARQTDDSLIVEQINEDLDELQEQTLRDALTDPDAVTNFAQVEQRIEEKFTEIRERVDTFEDVRQARLDESVRTDSDGDGISDYDEINVYNTDPEDADSDQDGFIDGAEVARGFNPTDPEPEAIVEYELPQEVFGLTRNDVLEVSQVVPVVEVSEDNQIERVKAEIAGVGLPNSFVTIYVFSTPVIVTVKTDDDGAFVYRFDKELEDGEHEVYVAFTDNTGSILAQSAPFQFVKEAQAFTPVDAAEEQVTVTAPSVVETSTINAIRLVLAMSILVLGFILLMLGINLRNTERSQDSLSSVQ